nr:tryptophan synthase beta chain 2 [Tanacetum cinerariifolium]
AINFARSEGLIPAPKPTHVITTAIWEANCCKESGESEVMMMRECICTPPQFSKLLL